MASILLKGKHTGGYYSVNSVNYTEASLSAEDYEPVTHALAFWTSDVDRTVQVGSGDGSTIGDLTRAGNSTIYAHVALSSLHYDVPTGGAFTDTDESDKRIAGELSWTKPADTSGITGYKVYWGTAGGTKLSAEALYTLPGVNNCSQTIRSGTAVPDGATCFLVYSYGLTGESSSCLVIPIVDHVVAAQAPVINTHPADATKNIGETATFAVSAIAPDGGSLTYQWQRSLDSGGTWSDLDGAATSASYITPALTYADNGAQYRCVVTNSKNGTTATA
jgi:hypothetical protein